jgi:hypothetical protein
MAKFDKCQAQALSMALWGKMSFHSLKWYNVGSPNNILPNNVLPKTTKAMFRLMTFGLTTFLPNDVRPKEEAHCTLPPPTSPPQALGEPRPDRPLVRFS